MVRQILPNNNEKCYSHFSPNFSQLNTPRFFCSAPRPLIKLQEHDQGKLTQNSERPHGLDSLCQSTSHTQTQKKKEICGSLSYPIHPMLWAPIGFWIGKIFPPVSSLVQYVRRDLRDRILQEDITILKTFTEFFFFFANYRRTGKAWSIRLCKATWGQNSGHNQKKKTTVKLTFDLCSQT
jgi:hypothetical protein